MTGSWVLSSRTVISSGASITATPYPPCGSATGPKTIAEPFAARSDQYATCWRISCRSASVMSSANVGRGGVSLQKKYFMFSLSGLPQKHLPVPQRLGLSDDHTTGQPAIQVGAAPGLQVRIPVLSQDLSRSHGERRVAAAHIAVRRQTGPLRPVTAIRPRRRDEAAVERHQYHVHHKWGKAAGLDEADGGFEGSGEISGRRRHRAA